MSVSQIKTYKIRSICKNLGRLPYALKYFFLNNKILIVYVLRISKIKRFRIKTKKKVKKQTKVQNYLALKTLKY